MKIAVLADIHANLPAFETVIDHVGRWALDAVVVLGDVVNRGPRPADCPRLVLERQSSRGWLLLRGNHEDYVVEWAQAYEPAVLADHLTVEESVNGGARGGIVPAVNGHGFGLPPTAATLSRFPPIQSPRPPGPAGPAPSPR